MHSVHYRASATVTKRIFYGILNNEQHGDIVCRKANTV